MVNARRVKCINSVVKWNLYLFCDMFIKILPAFGKCCCSFTKMNKHSKIKNRTVKLVCRICLLQLLSDTRDCHKKLSSSFSTYHNVLSGGSKDRTCALTKHGLNYSDLMSFSKKKKKWHDINVGWEPFDTESWFFYNNVQ